MDGGAGRRIPPTRLKFNRLWNAGGQPRKPPRIPRSPVVRSRWAQERFTGSGSDESTGNSSDHSAGQSHISDDASSSTDEDDIPPVIENNDPDAVWSAEWEERTITVMCSQTLAWLPPGCNVQAVQDAMRKLAIASIRDGSLQMGVKQAAEWGKGFILDLALILADEDYIRHSGGLTQAALSYPHPTPPPIHSS